MSSNKKGKTCRIIALILSGVLSVAAVVGAGTALYMGAKNNGWFDKEVAEEDDSITDENIESAGDIYINESASNGLTLTAAKLTADEYEEYGISTASVESAYTVTVSYNADASTPKFSWWCSDTSCVTITPSSDTKSCVVTCSSAFSTQITITCTACDVNSAVQVTASCTVDYYRRISDGHFKFYDGCEDTGFSTINWDSGNSTKTWCTDETEATSYDSTFCFNDSTVMGTGTAYQNYSTTITLYSYITSSTISTSSLSTYRSFLASITGVSSSLSNSSFVSSVYNKLISYYNSSTPAAVFTVTYIGLSTGDTHSFTFSLIIDPSYLI